MYTAQFDQLTLNNEITNHSANDIDAIQCAIN